MVIDKDEKEIVIPEPVPDSTIPEGYTEEEWGMLSSEDQEGIRDMLANPDAEDVVDEPEVKVEPDAAAQPAKDAVVDVEEPAKEAEAEVEVEVEVKPEASTGVVVSDEDLLAYRPVVSAKELEVVVTVPSDVLQKHNDAKQTLRDKFAADEISRDEYEDQLDSLKDELQDWKSTERFRLMEERRESAVWDKEQAAFWSARGEYLGDKQADGSYKRTPRSAAMMGAINEAIKQIETDVPGLPGMSLLIRADRVVRETFGLAIPGAKPAKSVADKAAETVKKAVEQKPPAEKPDLTTLSDVPAAGDNETGDVWATLDKLSGPKLEAFLAKQPQHVIDAYLESLS